MMVGRSVCFAASGFQLKECDRKKKRKVVEDRISELPDEILLCILSLLSLKEAAITSVLSKRWMNLWTFRPVLDFHDCKAVGRIVESGRHYEEVFERERRKFVQWVNRVLAVHRGDRLDEFKVTFGLCNSDQADIDRWLELSIAKGVQKLQLDLSFWSGQNNPSPTYYVFPDRLVSPGGDPQPHKPHPHCSVQTRSVDSFRFLTSLCLKSVSVTEKQLQFFLHNCPFLEQLVVRGADELVSVEVSGRSLALKHLEICFCFGLKTLIVRDAVNLVSLDAIVFGDLLLENVNALTDLTSGRCAWGGSTDLLSQLSSVLPHLVHFTLHIDKNDVKNLEHYNFPELTKLKQFSMVAVAHDDRSFLGITALIRAAPFLQRFVLQVNWTCLESLSNNLEQAKRITRQKTAREPPLRHRHLKVVEIWGFYGDVSELELIIYFLKNAPALEKIIIDPRCRLYPSASRYQMKRYSESRTRANEQLPRLMPPNVELVIL